MVKINTKKCLNLLKNIFIAYTIGGSGRSFVSNFKKPIKCISLNN